MKWIANKHPHNVTPNNGSRKDTLKKTYLVQDPEIFFTQELGTLGHPERAEQHVRREGALGAGA